MNLPCRSLLATVFFLPALSAQAGDAHDALVRQSVALEQLAEGRLAAHEADAVLADAARLAAYRAPSGRADARLADKAFHLHAWQASLRERREAGSAAKPPALPTPRIALGAGAPGSGCGSAIPLREGDALRLPVGTGAQVWLRVAANGDAPVSLTTRGSTLDPALAAFADCRVAEQAPFASADDSVGLQAELALVPRKQTFWYVRADNLSSAGDLVVSAVRAVALSGRVTRSVSGNGIAGVRVALFRNESGYYYFASSTVTDADGAYSLAAVGSGTFALRTGDDSTQTVGILHEAFDGFRCTGSYFDLYYCGTQGNNFTPIALADPAERIVDFALDVGGSISGTLTSSIGGPVSGAAVAALTQSRFVLRSTTSDALGRWRIDGLPPEGVYITASAVDHATTLHAGIECPGPDYFYCNVAAGTLVSAPLEGVVRVDMTLRRQQFVDVAFTVNGGAPPVDSYTYGIAPVLLNANGAVVAQGSSRGGGLYRIGPVAAGSYRLRATSNFAYPRLYPAVECSSDCLAELGLGEVINVAATDAVVERTMDLRRYPSLSGTVTTDGSGAPIGSASVALLPVGGGFYGGISTSTSATGGYRFDTVPPGTYILRFSSEQHADEVHQNVPCTSQNPALDCPGATLVSVGSNTPDRTIDASLARSATISGRITIGGQAYTGYGSFHLVRADGSIAASWSTYPGFDGRFTLFDVPGGTWRVGFLADSFLGYLPQLFPGVDCPAGSFGVSFNGCAIAQATPVVVQNGAAVTGIDFAPRRTGSQVVRVLNAFNDEPLAGVMIDVWNSLGQRVDSRATDASGRAYPVGASNSTPATAHALSTDNDQGLINEVYQDILCPNGSVFFGTCALSGFTPVLLPAVPNAPEITWRVSRPIPIFGANFEN